MPRTAPKPHPTPSPATDDSKTRLIQSQLHEVTDVMKSNIGKVIERGENLEVLVDKSDNLHQHSVTFHRQSRKMKMAMWWKRVRWYLLLLLILLILILLICWWAGAFN